MSKIPASSLIVGDDELELRDADAQKKIKEIIEKVNKIILEKLDQTSIVHTTGDAEDKVMSQAAATKEFAQLSEDISDETKNRQNAVAQESAARNAAIAQERNRAIARENEIEELFSLPTQEAVNKWLDEHPEATTTVQDHSLTIDKMVIGTTGYVTPQVFGAKGDGVTDDTVAFQTAIDSGFDIVIPLGTYVVANLNVNRNTIIDLNGSTLLRSDVGGCIFNCSAALTLKNGTIDGQNNGGNFAHLLLFNNGAENLTLENVNFENNLTGYPNIEKSIDSDHVYVLNANDVFIERCTFRNVSRQGVSLTNRCRNFTIRNSIFVNCYLFGFDFEPNTGAEKLCDCIAIENNVFTNCGQHSETDSVWNSGGAFAISCPTATGLTIVDRVLIRGNVINSDAYNQYIPGVVAPYAHVSQYASLTFEENTFRNMNRILIATNASENVRTFIAGNVFSAKDPNALPCGLYVYPTGDIYIKNNIIDIDLTYKPHGNYTTIRDGNIRENTRLGVAVDVIGKYMVKNNVSNGMLSDQTGWSANENVTDMNVSGNWLSFTGTGMALSNKKNWVYQKPVITKENHTYYLAVIAASANGDAVAVDIGAGYTRAGYEIVTENTLVSGIVEIGAIDDMMSTFAIGGDGEIRVTNAICLDLTDIFGDGNIPTKDELDNTVLSTPMCVWHWK